MVFDFEIKKDIGSKYKKEVSYVVRSLKWAWIGCLNDPTFLVVG